LKKGRKLKGKEQGRKEGISNGLTSIWDKSKEKKRHHFRRD
jgi:hypothetical protein